MNGRKCLSAGKHILTVCFAALGIVFVAGNAAADTLVYDLNTANSQLQGTTGVFGTVTVNLTDSKTAVITFASNTSSNAVTQNGKSYAVIFIDGSVVDMNVNGSFKVSNFSESTFFPNLLPSVKQINAGAGNVDGLGVFTLVNNNNSAFKNGATTVTFTLTNTSGTWAHASDVTIGNNKGNIVAAHVSLVTIDSHGNAVDNNNTGYATNTGGPAHPPVPEPTSMVLFGGLFAGLGWYGVRCRRLMSAAV